MQDFQMKKGHKESVSLALMAGFFVQRSNKDMLSRETTLFSLAGSHALTAFDEMSLYPFSRPFLACSFVYTDDGHSCRHSTVSTLGRLRIQRRLGRRERDSKASKRREKNNVSKDGTCLEEHDTHYMFGTTTTTTTLQQSCWWNEWTLDMICKVTLAVSMLPLGGKPLMPCSFVLI